MRCSPLYVQNIIAICAGTVRNIEKRPEACGRLSVGAFIRNAPMGVFHNRKAGSIKVEQLVAAPFKNGARQGGRSGIEVHGAICSTHWRSVPGVKGDPREHTEASTHALARNGGAGTSITRLPDEGRKVAKSCALVSDGCTFDRIAFGGSAVSNGARRAAGQGSQIQHHLGGYFEWT